MYTHLQEVAIIWELFKNLNPQQRSLKGHLLQYIVFMCESYGDYVNMYGIVMIFLHAGQQRLNANPCLGGVNSHKTIQNALL